jgi:TatD DNase family protein
MLLLPFDSHNHVHMGPTWPLSDATLSAAREISSSAMTQQQHHQQQQPQPSANLLNGCLSGMAVMSTHPRDFCKVLNLAELSHQKVIPCIGVHPWFLHELFDNDTSDDGNNNDDDDKPPAWISNMEDLLQEYPSMPVGEIGLDGFHFDPLTKNLTCSMERQVWALEWQLHLAIRYRRPVSLHCVRAMGPMMNSLAKVQKESNGMLPPKLYFHAFGGKAGTATQLIKTFERKNATTRVYFGFAPVINFESPKTLQVIREVGLDRLVLETDHEDAGLVASDMKLGVKVISKVFEISEHELIQITNQNACDLYSLH